MPGTYWALRILSATDNVPALVEISLVGRTLDTYRVMTVVTMMGSSESTEREPSIVWGLRRGFLEEVTFELRLERHKIEENSNANKNNS